MLRLRQCGWFKCKSACSAKALYYYYYEAGYFYLLYWTNTHNSRCVFFYSKVDQEGSTSEEEGFFICLFRAVNNTFCCLFSTLAGDDVCVCVGLLGTLLGNVTLDGLHVLPKLIRNRQTPITVALIREPYLAGDKRVALLILC